MKPFITPIIIAKANGKLRDGLLSLLENQVSIKIIDVIQDETTLFQQLNHQRENCVILLDVNLFGNDTFTILNRIKTDYPHLQNILLVNTYSQKKQAITAGFNHVLIKGFIADDLLDLIQLSHIEKLSNKDVVETHGGMRL